MARRVVAMKASALIMCAMLFATAMAGSSSASKDGAAAASSKGGNPCAKTDIGCASCGAKGSGKGGGGKGGGACTACSTNGPIPAELNANGRCFCPAGSARVGSPNTDSSPIVTAAVKTAGSGGKGGGKAVVVDRACAPCAVDSYASIARPVGTSKCTPCPPGTSTNGATGSTTCFVPAGSWFNVATQQGETCSLNSWCLGGDIASDGKLKNPCPARSTTQGKTGQDEFADCIANSGSYYDGTNVVPCPSNSFCGGGSIGPGGEGTVATACPTYTETPSPGAPLISGCAIAPGFYWHPAGYVALCEAGNYCLGGSPDGSGAIQTPCTPPATSSPGASRAAQCGNIPACGVAGSACGPNAICSGDGSTCVCSPGYYGISQAPNVACTECGNGYYCTGLTTDPANRVECPLGQDTNGVTTATSSADCVVSSCDPCGGSANPTTFFVSGTGKSVYVANSLDPTTASPTPPAQAICTMPTNTPEFSNANSAINDVAATSTGQLLIAGRPGSSNAAGFILLLDPAAQTYGAPCVYEKLLDIAPAVAGLGGGPKSDLFYGSGGSTGQAFISTYQLSETAGGSAQLTPLGSADVSSIIGGAIGASDITASPTNPNQLYFTSGTKGFTINLDGAGLPVAASTAQVSSGSIGLNAPAAWCNSAQPFAGSASSANAYAFTSPAFTDVGTTTMPVNGLSGAATLPKCGVV